LQTGCEQQDNQDAGDDDSQWMLNNSAGPSRFEFVVFHGDLPGSCPVVLVQTEGFSSG
jgi:hypothetical protein